jgi:hypothetical protein
MASRLTDYFPKRPIPESSARRFALVFGGERYPDLPLDPPVPEIE